MAQRIYEAKITPAVGDDPIVVSVVTIHELATNAVKYGALSVPEGQIHIEWSRAPEERLLFQWTETGGSLVRPSARRGFGTRVIESMIRDQMQGEVRFDWRTEGLVCEIWVPASN
jgi:two-component sensor histidine kinase